MYNKNIFKVFYNDIIWYYIKSESIPQIKVMNISIISDSYFLIIFIVILIPM